MTGWHHDGLRLTAKQVGVLLALDANLPLPPVQRITLTSLWDRGLLTCKLGGTWAITDLGKQRARTLMAWRSRRMRAS